MYDNLADLYSIILAIEHLEKAYVRDSIDNTAYSKACTKLIAQYKTLQASVEDHVPDLETFVAEYDMECKAAVNRIKVCIYAGISSFRSTVNGYCEYRWRKEES